MVRRDRIVRAVGGSVVVIALVGAGLGASPAGSDPAPDRWIMAGDQAVPELIALDPAVSDWNSASAVMWRWKPTSALGFSAGEIAAFDGVTDFKLRNTPAGQRVVLSSGSGLAAVIAYPSGQRQWAQVLPASANLHSAELLPNGNVAVTSTNTTAGYVRVYAASQGPNASGYTQYSLHAQSHGSLWDPVTERLWIIGKEGSDPTDPRIISALAVTGTDADPRLSEDHRKWHELPDIGSHDLTPDPNDPHQLLISTDAHTYEFDKTASSNAFTELPASSGGLEKVKAISRQPSGQTVQTRPDEYKVPEGPCAAVNYWCTDTVDFYGPDTTRTRTGAQFYRARVMNPDYNAIGDIARGPVWDRERSTAGSWGTPSAIDTNTGITAMSAAALPDGSLHVQTVVPGAGVWDRTRSASGVWSSSTQIDGNGAVADVSAAALPDGSLHVQTLIPGAGVWDRTRSASGVWSGATKIDDACEGTLASDPCTTQVAAAALPSGVLHVFQTVPGHGVVGMARNTSGTWGSPVDIDVNSAITRVSAAGLPDGTLHVQTVVPGYGLWDRTRSVGGSWSSAAKIDGNSMIFDVYGAALPTGQLHVGHAQLAP